MTSLLGGAPTGAMVVPTVTVDGTDLSQAKRNQLMRTVVDTHLHLPDMFELHFNDQTGQLVDELHLKIGSAIKIAAGKDGDTSTKPLIEGEVTGIEAICVDSSVTTIIRGYEKAHRLQRARRSRTFIKMSDSAIASEVASKAGLKNIDVEDSSITHDHVAQVSQTDWDFLTQRAREIGFETGVSQGKFFFRKASGLPKGGGGLLGAAASMASAAMSALGIGASGTLTFKKNLHTFLPRISGANLTPNFEVRVWDPKTARVAVGTADAKTGAATIDGQEPGKLAKSFTDGLAPSLPSLPALPQIPGLPKLDFGSTPSNTAFVVSNHPLAVGSAADTAADQAAKSVADHVSSTFAEAEGVADGDPTIQAGSQVTIDGVPGIFAGKWTVTNARHIFDPLELGYRTHFFVSGRSDRSLLALASGGTSREHAPSFGGVVCGVVTNVKDPDKKGKVKIALPWLAPDFETDWARVVHIAAGARTGTTFLPEVGDEVLVGFEYGDMRRPYVLGGLVNDNSKFAPLGSAVNGGGSVAGRGIASPAGNTLLFTDELPPGPAGVAPPTKSEIKLGTGDGNLSLAIDQVAGTLTITCKPAPPASRTPAGTLTIDCSGAGKIEIKGGAGGVKVESDGQLELTGKLGVKITSNAMVQVQGQMIQLN